MDDPRPDELLEECARTAWRLRLALAWSDALEGPGAKACSRTGSANWKNAKPLPEEEGAAVGFFLQRSRRRNPAVVASASGLLLLEADGNLEQLLALHGLPPLPETVGVRSRRGSHRYLRPPPGESPLKVQLAEEGITTSSDGYLIGAGAIHPSGWIYQYENGVETVADASADLYRLLVAAGDTMRARTAHLFETGEPIATGLRNDAIFHLALELVRDGKPKGEILERLLQVNELQCRPPLETALVKKQLQGAVVWARRNPTEQEQLRARARAILDGHREGASEPETGAPPPRQAKTKRRALSRRPLREIAAERVSVLAGTPLPIGTLTLVAGIGGLGKSALALSWAKQVTDQGGSVLVISYEDAAGAVIRPRFEALGGDLDRLFVLGIDSLEGEVSFPSDLPELDRHVRETEARLVIVDPVSASIDLKLDSHRDQDVRVVLGQLARLAERERLALVEVAHLNKAPGSDIYLRVNGSTAFFNAARLVVTVTPDKVDPDWQRIVAAHKFNYGAVPEPERWRVEPVTIDTPAGAIEVMTLRFIEIADDVSREDVLAPTTVDKTDAATLFLRDALADGEWHDSLGLKALAGARKIAERTLKRTAAELEVEHERRGFPSSTWWRMPQSGHGLSPDSGPTGEAA